jgi:hypothetical protein
VVLCFSLRAPRSALGLVPGVVGEPLPRAAGLGLVARPGSLGQVAGGVVLGADPGGLALALGHGRLVGAVGVVVVGVDLVDLVVRAGLLQAPGRAVAAGVLLEAAPVAEGVR